MGRRKLTGVACNNLSGVIEGHSGRTAERGWQSGLLLKAKL